MMHLFRSIGLAAIAVTAFQTQAADSNPARQASEIEPTESQRGETANRGPRKFGEDEAVVEKKEEKTEKTEKHEHKEKKEKKRKKDEKASNGDKSSGLTKDGQCATCGKADCVCGDKSSAYTTGLEATIAVPAKTELAKADFDRKMRTAIRKLSTSGWREAQIELLDGGKSAIPYLIDAMAAKDEEGAKAPAYNLGAHTKSDAGRAPRQRSVAEVASELLTNIVSNHSSFKGELPAGDQKAWQEWWIANGESVTFSK